MRIGALLVVGSLALAACNGAVATTAPAPTGTATATGTPAVTGTPAATPTAMAEVCPTGTTLIVWDQEVREGIGASIDTLIGEFEAAHPGTTIDRQQKSFDDLKATVLQAMADPAGPDIAQVNQGRPDMGAAVTAGLLLPLTDYAEEYGWNDRWAAGVLARNSFSDDGKEFGTGSLYGLSITGEIVGLYYNKDKYTALELTEPTTWAEFEAQLQTIKTTGEVPISFGDQGGGGSIQVYGSILETTVAAQWLNDWIFGRAGSTFDTPEVVAAADKLVELAGAGDFTDGYAGIAMDDAAVAFAGGEGVYLWGGSWYGPGITEAAGEHFGFMRVPPQTAGGSALSIGGVGLPWSIRKTSANADCAAAFLDLITSDHAMELVAAAGVLPGHESANAVGTSDLFNDLAAAFADANGKDEVGHYLDWAFAGGYDVFNAELAKVLAGQETSAEFATAIDTAYQDFLATIE